MKAPQIVGDPAGAEMILLAQIQDFADDRCGWRVGIAAPRGRDHRAPHLRGSATASPTCSTSSARYRRTGRSERPSGCRLRRAAESLIARLRVGLAPLSSSLLRSWRGCARRRELDLLPIRPEFTKLGLEAPPGFEPGMEVLQIASGCGCSCPAPPRLACWYRVVCGFRRF